LTALQNEVDSLQFKLGAHEDADTIVRQHIKLLHQYNEAKDAAQAWLNSMHLCTSDCQGVTDFNRQGTWKVKVRNIDSIHP